MIVSKSIRTLCIYLRLKYKAPNKRRNTLCSQGVDKMHHKDVKREEGKKRGREGERERERERETYIENSNTNKAT